MRSIFQSQLIQNNTIVTWCTNFYLMGPDYKLQVNAVGQPYAEDSTTILAHRPIWKRSSENVSGV